MDHKPRLDDVRSALSAKVWNIWLVVAVLSLASLLILIFFGNIDNIILHISGERLPAVSKDILINLFTTCVSLAFIGIYYERTVRFENIRLFHQEIFSKRIIMEDLSEDRVIEIGKHALSRIFQDEEFGADVFSTFQNRAKRTNERWYNYESRIVLREHNTNYFEFLITTTYLKRIRDHELIFTVTSDIEDWERTIMDRGTELCHYLKPIDQLRAKSAISKDDFELTGAWVNDEKLEIEEFALNGNVAYRIKIPDAITSSKDSARIFYTLRTFILRRNHVMAQGPGVPTKGISISFDYAQTDIKRVSLMPFFSSASKPIFISSDPRSDRVRQVVVDGWVLPRSGVAFGWTMNDEADLEHKLLIGPSIRLDAPQHTISHPPLAGLSKDTLQRVAIEPESVEPKQDNSHTVIATQ